MKRSVVTTKITFEELTAIQVASDLLSCILNMSGDVSDEMNNMTQDVLTEGDVLRLAKLAKMLQQRYSDNLKTL